MSELKGSSPSPDSFRSILRGVRAEQDAAVRGGPVPEQKPLTPAGPDITAGAPGAPGEGAGAAWRPPSWLPEPGEGASGTPSASGVEPPDIARNAPDAVRLPRREPWRKQAGQWLKDTFWSKEDRKAALITGTTLGLIRTGINWGTGGLGLAASAGAGALVGGGRAFVQDVYRQHGEKIASFKQNIESKEAAGGDVTSDYRSLNALEDLRSIDFVTRLRAADKKRLVRTVVGAAAWGAVGAVAGFEIKELGIPGIIKEKLAEHLERFGPTRVVGMGIMTAIGGGLLSIPDKLHRFVSSGNKKELFNKSTAYRILGGALIGATLGEVFLANGGIPESEYFDPVEATKAATAIASPTAVKEAATPGIPKPAVAPGSPGPVESPAASPAVRPAVSPAVRPAVSPEAPRAVVSPEPSATPTSTATATATEVPRPPTQTPVPTETPKAPPVQSPVPEGSPTPRRILPKPPVGSIFDSQPQNRLVNYIPEGSHLISFNSITLGEVVSDVDNYRIPADLTDYVKDSVNELGSDDGATRFAELMANEKTWPLQDLNPGDTTELSLKGKLEGKIGNWLVNNPKDADVEHFLDRLKLTNKSDFFNLDSAIADIQNGSFDPYNADHAKIVHLFTQQEPVGKAMLGLSYVEVKAATEGASDVFSKTNPDYFAQAAKVNFPRSIDDYSENGWFSKVRKCIRPTGPVI